MAQTNSKNDSPKGEEESKPNFSQSQYDMLKRCSDKKDMTEWNEWRKANPEEKILLEGANFRKAFLKGAELNGAHLENADLWGAHLQNIHFHRAYLQKANMNNAHLEGKSDLSGANLEGADLGVANLRGAYLNNAYLKNATLNFAHLEDVDLSGANMEWALLLRAHLEDAFVIFANLRFASLLMCTVNGGTLFDKCVVNRKTNFYGVALESARIGAGMKQLLEYNIRRMNWEEWYQGHKFLKWPVREFWKISDYGRSTIQIINVFFSLAAFFAVIYWSCACIWEGGIVSNLVEYEGAGGTVIEVPKSLVPLRSLYFSIVTMTTLGFGDMYASAESFWRGLFGHLLLGIQVILGYMLLGALVTRFAVLFTADGPAGSLDELTIEEKKKLTEMKTKKKAKKKGG